jgi:hypothetical protein
VREFAKAQHVQCLRRSIQRLGSNFADRWRLLGFFLLVLSVAFAYSSFTGEILLGLHFWPIVLLFIMCYIQNGFLISSFIYFMAFALVLILPTSWHHCCNIDSLQVPAFDYILFMFVLTASHGFWFAHSVLRVLRSGTPHGARMDRASFAQLHYPAHMIGSLAIVAFVLVNVALSQTSPSARIGGWMAAVVTAILSAYQIASRVREARFFSGRKKHSQLMPIFGHRSQSKDPGRPNSQLMSQRVGLEF